MTLKEQYKKVDLLKAQLEKFQPLKPQDEQRLWKKFRLEWNFNSNHMEGNTLTYGHTELLLIFDKISGDYTGREIEEMKAHDVAIKMVLELARDKERELTESFIRQLNQIILVRPFWKEAETPDGQMTRREITPGEYKRFPNSVRLENGEMFNYATPEETPALMGDLMNFYRTSVADSSIHPLWLAAMMHYKFVRIHPFDDGNGRVARLLMNYVLLKHGYPSVIIKDSGKKDYLMALNKADIGDLEAFAVYIGTELQWSLDISIRAAKGESIDEDSDLDKKVELLKRNLKGINKTILRNKEVVARIVHDNYIELIRNIDNAVERFTPLFASKSWAIEFNSTADFVNKSGPYIEESLDDIIERLKKLTEEGHDANYGTRCLFRRFNDEDATFNIPVFFRIDFDLKDYIIKVDLGQAKDDHPLYVYMARGGLNDSEIDFNLLSIKLNYNKEVEPEQIAAWAKFIAKKLFEIIEKCSEIVNDERKKDG